MTTTSPTLHPATLTVTMPERKVVRLPHFDSIHVRAALAFCIGRDRSLLCQIDYRPENGTGRARLNGETIARFEVR